MYENEPIAYKAVLSNGREEFVVMHSLEGAIRYAQNLLEPNTQVWLYKLTNNDGFDAGHPLIYSATRIDEENVKKAA